MDRCVLHGTVFGLSGNSTFDNPDVQVKMSEARLAMDMWLSIQSHINTDMEPTYGRDTGSNPYDVTPVFDDGRFGVGGDIDGRGWKWYYVFGYKFIHVDHYEEKPPHYLQEVWTSKIFPVVPCLAAYKVVGDTVTEMGIILCGPYFQGGYYYIGWPQYIYDMWSVHDYSLMHVAWSTPGYVPSSDNYVGLTRLFQTKLTQGPAPDPRLGHHIDFDYREVLWNVQPVVNELIQYPDWQKIGEIMGEPIKSWEEVIPFGHTGEGDEGRDIIAWSKWKGVPEKHSMGGSGCWPPGDTSSRNLHTRDGHWYAGTKYLDTICEGDQTTPILAEGIIEGIKLNDQIITFVCWPFCDGKWPWNPELIGSQGDENIWGYINYMQWGSPFVVTMPPVPTDDAYPETHPNVKWWDFHVPPNQWEQGAGFWFQYYGSYLGDPSRYWAVRVGTQAGLEGGWTEDLNYLYHGQDHGQIVRDYPYKNITEQHGFFYVRGNAQYESVQLREFGQDPLLEGFWPFDFSSLFELCPCYMEYSDCERPLPGSFPYCVEADEEWTEDPDWEEDQELYWTSHSMNLQYNGETYVLLAQEDASGGYPAVSLYQPAGAHHLTGGWMLHRQGVDGGASETFYLYIHITPDGLLGGIELQCTEPEESGLGYKKYQPFPGIRGYDPETEEFFDVYVGPYTRLMVLEQEQRHVLGEVYMEAFGPQGVDVGTGTQTVAGIPQE